MYQQMLEKMASEYGQKMGVHVNESQVDAEQLHKLDKLLYNYKVCLMKMSNS